MPYVISHSYLPETIDLAEEYKIVLINERKYYLYVCDYLRKNSCFLESDLEHYIDETRSNYFAIYRKVKEEDKRYFASLVRALIYEHYFEELVKPHTNKPLSYFLSKIYVLNKVNKTIPPILKDEKVIVMDTIDKYKKEVSVNVQLIHGKPVELWTESELIAVIREARTEQNEIADLVETSSRMKAKHEQIEKDIAVYVSALDAIK
ncbi:MAG: hypothetical protein ACKO7M_13055 [Acinetobacter junii]